MREKHGWQTSDTLNTLAMSIVIEANELLEAFLNDEVENDKLKSELADVLMYGLSLAHDAGLDVEEIIKAKIAEVNSRNYEK